MAPWAGAPSAPLYMLQGSKRGEIQAGARHMHTYGVSM